MRILIIGAGEVGFHIAQRLAGENKDVVVIDINPESLTRVAEQLDVQTIQGSGASPGILEQAGIHEAEMFLAVTNSDEINLIACFFANALAPNLRKVARFRNEEYSRHSSLNGLGISTVINPDDEVVNSVMRLLSVPGALEINEFIEGRVKLIGMPLPQDSPLAGVPLMRLPEVIGQERRVLIAALARDERLIIPKGTDVIEGGDIVYYVCDSKSLPTMLSFFGAKAQPIKDILIIGGGNLGFKLAKALDSRKYHTKIVDSDSARGEELSEELDRVIILNGDGTDQELLEQENAGNMDAVIAMTGDEESNILSCLLAKRVGARKTVARINKFAYLPLVKTIGIDHTASPRLSAVNSILHHIRRGKVLSTAHIKGEEAEIIEAIALENSQIVGRPVQELGFPMGAIILCVLRGDDVVIPKGDFVIQPQDHILVLAIRSAVARVERALSTGLERV